MDLYKVSGKCQTYAYKGYWVSDNETQVTSSLEMGWPEISWSNPVNLGQVSRVEGRVTIMEDVTRILQAEVRLAEGGVLQAEDSNEPLKA